MSDSYKLKITDDLSLYNIPAQYLPISKSMAEELIASGREIYSLYYSSQDGVKCVTSKLISINSLQEEEETQLFCKRLVDPSRLTQWLQLKQDIDKIEAQIAEIETDFRADAEIAGTNISVSCNRGIAYTTDKIKVTCTMPNLIKELLGQDSGITPKAQQYDVPKVLQDLATAIEFNMLSPYNSIDELLAYDYPHLFDDTVERQKFCKKIRKTAGANIKLFKNTFGMSNTEAMELMSNIEKVNNTVLLNKWYMASGTQDSLEEFKEKFLCGFQFSTSQVITTKTT